MKSVMSICRVVWGVIVLIALAPLWIAVAVMIGWESLPVIEEGR